MPLEPPVTMASLPSRMRGPLAVKFVEADLDDMAEVSVGLEKRQFRSMEVWEVFYSELLLTLKVLIRRRLNIWWVGGAACLDFPRLS